MFNNNRKDVKSSGSNFAFIANGDKVIGDLICSNGIEINGSIKGKINSKTVVSVLKDGEVDGTIQAKELVVEGKIDGEIICDIVRIVKNGVVNARITASQLIIEEGAVFIGESVPANAQKKAKINNNQIGMETIKEDNKEEVVEDGLSAKERMKAKLDAKRKLTESK